MKNTLKMMKIGSVLAALLLSMVLTMCGGGGPSTPGISLSGITINPTDGLLTTESGGSDFFIVVLKSEPTADVTIGIYCNDSTEGTVDTSSLIFTSGNWNIPQVVTVTGVNDVLDDGNQVYKIITDPAVSNDSDYNGLDADDVSFTNVDDDSPGITINPSYGLVTTEAGGTDSFVVVLNTPPSADVTIELSSSDTDEGTVNTSSLTFTANDWDITQTVTVSGVDDTKVDGIQPYTIVTSAASSTDADYDGIDPSDVVATNSDDEVNIVAGEYHSLLLSSDGTLWAWGKNSYGQLGDGTYGDKNIPTQIGTDTDWAWVASGWNHNVALKSDGTLWAWGRNDSGQLGIGRGPGKNIPTQIGTNTDWSFVEAGSYRTVAVKTDGTLWRWGSKIYTPVQIDTDNDWAIVAEGNGYTVAVKTDGTLWAWGNNSNGQLGDGTTANKNSPTLIGADTDWAFVEAGDIHTVAVKTDGTLWSWGGNGNGQLGDGTNINTNMPIQIGNDTDWAYVTAGVYHTVAVKTDGTLWAWNRVRDIGIAEWMQGAEGIPDRSSIPVIWYARVCGDRGDRTLDEDDGVRLVYVCF